MKLLQRIRCFFGQHAWTVGEGDHPADIAAERNCECGAHIPAIKWPRSVSRQQTIWLPTGPRMGMHRPAPPAPVPPPARIVANGVHPHYQDAWNRKHKCGAYDPAYLADVERHKDEMEAYNALVFAR